MLSTGSQTTWICHSIFTTSKLTLLMDGCYPGGVKHENVDSDGNFERLIKLSVSNALL